VIGDVAARRAVCRVLRGAQASVLRRAQKPQSEAVCRNVRRRKTERLGRDFWWKRNAEEFPTVPRRRSSAALPHVAPRVAFCGAGWHPCPSGRENRLFGDFLGQRV